MADGAIFSGHGSSPGTGWSGWKQRFFVVRATTADDLVSRQRSRGSTKRSTSGKQGDASPSGGDSGSTGPTHVVLLYKTQKEFATG